jgi:hypothetical protein
MNIGEPMRIISSVLVDGRRCVPIGAGRWHVLFGSRQRPLLMPAESYHLQKKWLSFFVGSRVKALYARALLRLNALAPDIGLLPGLRVLCIRHRSVSEQLDDAPMTSTAAIQIGTTGPYQKAAALLISESGQGLALAKIALVPSADCMVAAEAAWLKYLAGISELADQVPRLLAEGKAAHGRHYIVISLAPTNEVTTEFTDGHEKFLGRLGRARLDTGDFAASACCQSIEHALAEVSLYARHEEVAQLHCAWGECRKLLSRFSGPFVFSQGDFVWWNIRVQPSRIFVFDWEYARLAANPLADILNYQLLKRAAAGRNVSRRYLIAAMTRARAFARKIHSEWKWTAQEISGLVLAYVLQVLLDYSRASKSIVRTEPVVRCYWRLMESRSTWLAA